MNTFTDPFPIGARMTALLVATEAGLADGIAPLSHEFLCDNEVTLDEAHALAEHIRSACQVYRKAPASTVTMAMVEAMLEAAR